MGVDDNIYRHMSYTFVRHYRKTMLTLFKHFQLTISLSKRTYLTMCYITILDKTLAIGVKCGVLKKIPISFCY